MSNAVSYAKETKCRYKVNTLSMAITIISATKVILQLIFCWH